MYGCESGGDKHKRRAASLFSVELMHGMSLKTELWPGRFMFFKDGKKLTDFDLTLSES